MRGLLALLAPYGLEGTPYDTSPRCPLAHDNQRAPESGMPLKGSALVDHVEHRLTHGLRPAKFLIGRHSAHSIRNQLHGGTRVDGPVRDEQRSCTRVEERAC